MRFALIGCGNIGQLRAQAISRSPGNALAVAVDLDRDRATSLAAAHGAEASADWKSVLGRTDVDAVIVSTAPSLHAEMTVAALEAGKHVLCEKPLARSVEECREMVQAADRTGRFLATGFNYRFYPSAAKARELLDSGIIGELDHIRSYTGYSATAHDHAWLHDAKVMGGGALRDNGIHLIDLTTWFLGDVADIKGFGSNAVWGFEGCEDNGFALLRSKSGRIASLQASWTEWRGYQLKVEIYGTLGCIRMWCFPMITQVVWADKIGGRTRKKTHLFPKTQLTEKLHSYRRIVVDSFVEEIDAFVKAANGGKSNVATGRDGLLTIEVADGATRMEPAGAAVPA
ncbi:MAG TPA: Gfo/Idh/MocA family oxidoreductase [Rhodothermales bacterium]